MRRLIGCGVAAGLVAATGLSAQDSPSTRTAGLTFDQSLRATGNDELAEDSGGTDLISSTRLGFTTTVVDEVNSLQFSTSTALRLSRLTTDEAEAEAENGFSSPRLNLSYTRTGAASELRLRARYRNEEIRFLRPLDDVLLGLGEVVLDEDGNTIVVDTDGEILIDEEGEAQVPGDTFDLEGSGRVAFYGVDMGLQLRQNAPLSLGLSLGLDGRDYIDTVDPDLFDRRTIDAGVRANLRLSPVSGASLGYTVERYEADDSEETDRTTRRISIGYDRAVSRVLDMSADLGYTRIETDTVSGITETEGLNGGLALTLARPRGNLRAGIDISTDEDGNRTTARIGRSLSLPDGGLDASLGVTRREGEDAALERIASLTYSRQLPSGNLNLGLNRQVADLDDDDEERLVTTLSSRYAFEVNELSSFSLSGAYSLREDESRANLGVTYSRTLTEDWAFNTGVSVILADEENGLAASPSVYFNIGRAFTLPF